MSLASDSNRDCIGLESDASAGWASEGLKYQEFCHCFYGIADETEVKHMVSDIVRRYINPDKTFETLFPNWPAG